MIFSVFITFNSLVLHRVRSLRRTWD